MNNKLNFAAFSKSYFLFTHLIVLLRITQISTCNLLHLSSAVLLTYSPKLDFTQTSSLFSTEAAAAASHTLPDNLYIKRFVLVRWPLTSNHVIRAVNYRNLSCRVESQKNLCVKMGFWEQICIHTIKFEIGQESSIPEDTHDFVQQCLNQSTNDDSWWCWALNCSLIHWWAEDQALWWALNWYIPSWPLLSSLSWLGSTKYGTL